MRVTIKLFATLRRGRDKILEKEYPEGTIVRDIIKDLNIDENDVAILLKNGISAKMDNEPLDGDTLSIFPPIGGG
ncbi:MoaD/ThiS family protein [Sedimentibacter sp.]|uniref:MoaD/ThiS family protein n=1 Tax=Sedimentibacter sp. TaxID=1960295 RepID=UPI0028A93E67|nr:MoaD/ThiS family protein [Sedimentibacter sp.]